jgi:hypothetical protein
MWLDMGVRICEPSRFGAAIMAMVAFWLSCGSEETLRPVDCALLCDRYEECVEPIDMEACVTKCEQHVSVSRVYGLSAVTCQDCIAGKTCDRAAQCWDTCPVRIDD